MEFLYPTHLFFMILAFAVFTTSFLSGVSFLVQENEIKNHRLTAWVRRLPALETMSKLHYQVLTAGFVLLSAGILVGALLSKVRAGRFFTGDPREIGAILTWLLYAVFLNVRTRAGWRGRKGIFLSLLGFLGVVLTFIGLEHRM